MKSALRAFALFSAALLLTGTASALNLPLPSGYSLLGHSCGGVKITPTILGFDVNGDVQGSIFTTTSCSSAGRGSRPTVYSATTAITWDLYGGYVLPQCSSLQNQERWTLKGRALTVKERG